MGSPRLERQGRTGTPPGKPRGRPVGSSASSARTGATDPAASRAGKGDGVEEEYDLFVGVDWGEASASVCVLDGAGKMVRELAVAHSGEALERFFEALTRLSAGQAERAAVAIEVPRGALVEGLIERGFAVYSINPKQLDRFRDRHTVAGAKDDRRDAYVLADSLRTDTALYRRLKLDDPQVLQLRELSRLHDDLTEEFRRVANRLRQQLHRYFPQVLALSAAADDPWVWGLLRLAPTPAQALRLSPRRLGKLLQEHRIRRFDLLQVAQTLSTPALPVAPGVVEAASGHVRILLEQIELIDRQRKACDRDLKTLLDQMQSEGEGPEHRGVAILLSLPGIGRSVAATMLAEAHEPLVAADYPALRSLCGVAPVTKQSGKSRHVLMRRACNRRLRNAVYHMARIFMQHDPVGRSRYQASRARGHSHGRALRQLADRILRVLAAMLRSGSTYRPPLAAVAP